MNIGNFANEFMARRAAKRVIPSQDFDISIANAREPDVHQRPAGPQLG